MPYEIFLALRLLRSRRGRLVRVTALAGATGIACGVAALIIALALANGFRDEMRDKILRGTAHITLLREDGAPVREWRETIARVSAVEGVTGAHATTYEGALLSGAEGAAYAIVRGLDAGSEHAIDAARRTLIEGDIEPLFHAPPDTPPTNRNSTGADESEEQPIAAVIGEELAKRLRLRVGDEAEIITGERMPAPTGFAPRQQRVRVVGLHRTGLYEYDATWIYVSLATAGHLAGAQDTAAVISIMVADADNVAPLAARARAAAGDGWATVDWQEANRPLFAALELEKRTVAIIIALIVLVAALNITTTLALLVVERRADIAILGALGARAASVRLIFLLEGALIGAAGALAGVLLGLLVCYLGNRFQLVRLPADVYSISAVPFHARFSDAAVAALVAFLISLLATIYPARAAARLRPAEALRYE